MGEADVVLAGRTFRVRRSLLEDADAQNLGRALAELHRPLLVFHSPTDAVVGVDNACRIFEAARHPKSFVSLDGADHLLTRSADAAYVATVLAAWATRYVSHTARPRTMTASRDMDAGAVVVQESGDGRLTQSVQAGRHLLTADEPFGVGDDLGPTPYDLLLAALGTCTSMTLRMYADRKGWPLERVTVRLAHERAHAQDCADPDTNPCVVDHIDRSVTLDGPLTDGQRSALVAIAERCPVHRTLAGVIRVTTTLV